MTSASDLFALQEVDLKRDSRRALVADIESRLIETDELIAARERVVETTTEAEALRKRQKEFDDAGADLDARIGPMETKLYSGSVRNPKELSDLQKEVESLKNRRSKLDDESLGMIENLEAANTALKEATASLRRIQGEWEMDQEDLLVAKQRAEAEIGQYDADRAVRIKGMDAPALGLYENLRKSRSGRGVARVERGNCQGCRLTLPTHLVQRLRSGYNLIQCPSCERILVAG